MSNTNIIEKSGGMQDGTHQTTDMTLAEDCPGVGTEQSGKSSACDGCPGQKYCSTGTPIPENPDVAIIGKNLSSVKNIIVVLSGKGGVGKSLTAMMLARALAQDEEKDIGLLDIDICGPSVPTMTKQIDASIHQSGTGWVPVYIDDNLSLMSAGFLIGGKDNAVIWRGSKKTALIRNFLRDTEWGDLDYLIIDAPPGTSDEHLSLVQFLKEYKGTLNSVIVTTSSILSIADVRREISFCEKSNLGILGVIENMCSYCCPKCGHNSNVFSNDEKENTETLCQEKNLSILAKFPMNPFLAYLIDNGEDPFEEKFNVPTESLELYKTLSSTITSKLS